MSEVAHNLLSSVIEEKYGISKNQVIILKDEKGKPYVEGKADIFVSLSHSKGTVMCVVSDKQIGIDVEKCAERRKSVESRVFTEFETTLINNAKDENKAFFTLWTLKESYLKAIGTGFADNAKSIEFFSIENPIKSNNQDYSFETGEYDGFVFAVCEKKY